MFYLRFRTLLYTSRNMKNIIIIWAGAAWLMTAATILESHVSNYHIHLFEKNLTPGKKVIISWGGRCNVTTSVEDKRILSTKYTRWWEFIRKAISIFSPRKCYEWFESHGVPLKVQDDLRVFPVSDDGRDIVGVFESIFAKYRERITLHYEEVVGEVWLSDLRCEKNDIREQGTLKIEKKFHITTPKWSYEADILVITTGGNAYSHTGSTGDGYAFARSLGHSVTQIWPSLSSFLTGESWLHELSGLVLNNSQFIIHNSPLSWSLLLTHFGISWPLAFMLSSELAWEEIGTTNPRKVQLIPIAEMTDTHWEIFLKDQFQNHPKKFLWSILIEKLPRRFAEALVIRYFSHIRETFAGSISRKDRENISNLLGNGIPMTLLERRPGDEFVTAWWVSTDELDPDAMESQIHENLYFAGEVLNVDGYTGGFSLQICWASGYAVGENILSKIVVWKI